jgi:hypothetical protein
MTEAQLISESFGFHSQQLARIVAGEEFIEFSHSESFKS